MVFATAKKLWRGDAAQAFSQNGYGRRFFFWILRNGGEPSGDMTPQGEASPEASRQVPVDPGKLARTATPQGKGESNALQ